MAVTLKGPAIDASVSSAINSALGFQQGSDNVQKAMEVLHSDVKSVDYIKGDGNQSWLKTAGKALLFVLTFSLVGKSYANTQNAARAMIRNPEALSGQIKGLHAMGNTLEDTLNKDFTVPLTGVVALGDEGKAQSGLAERQETVTGFNASIEALQKAIDTVATSGNLNATERRALYGAAIASTIGQGLSDVRSNGSSEQSLAIATGKHIWHSGNASVVGKDISAKMRSVPDETAQTHTQRMEALAQAGSNLTDLDNEILVEAARVVLISKGTDLGSDPAALRLALVSNPDLKAEVSAIKEQFSKEAAPRIQGEVTRAIGRVNAARNIEALKKSFLEDRKSELRDLSGNTKKGEEALRLAVQFNGLGEYAGDIVGGQIKQTDAVREAREDLAQNLSNFLGSLESARSFVEDLNDNFAKYVAEKEEEAQANADLIGQLLEMSPTGESHVADHAQLVSSIKAGVEVEAKVPVATKDAVPLGTVSKKIDPSAVKSAKTLDTADYISLLKIVVGTGKDESLGSPTLAGALLDSLQRKGQLGAVFTALNIANASKGTEGLQRDIRLAEGSVQSAEEAVRQAEAHEKTFWVNNSGYKAAQEATRKAKAKLEEARRNVAQLQEQLLSAASHVGSNAYVAPVVRQDGESPKALGSRALHDAQLTVEFTDPEGPLKALREALAKANVTSKSVDSADKADGNEDGNVA